MKLRVVRLARGDTLLSASDPLLVKLEEELARRGRLHALGGIQGEVSAKILWLAMQSERDVSCIGAAVEKGSLRYDVSASLSKPTTRAENRSQFIPRSVHGLTQPRPRQLAVALLSPALALAYPEPFTRPSALP